jgi:hypothetical protein
MAEVKDSVLESVLEAFRDCPVCFEPYGERVHQCVNGHMCCFTCYDKLAGNNCPTCKSPVDGRARAIETLRGKTTVKCAGEGCGVHHKLNEFQSHALDCIAAPVECTFQLAATHDEADRAFMEGEEEKLTCTSKVHAKDMIAHLESAHLNVHRPLVKGSDSWIFEYTGRRATGDNGLVILQPARGEPLVLRMINAGYYVTTQLNVVPCSFAHDEHRWCAINASWRHDDQKQVNIHTGRVCKWQNSTSISEVQRSLNCHVFSGEVITFTVVLLTEAQRDLALQPTARESKKGLKRKAEAESSVQGAAKHAKQESCFGCSEDFKGDDVAIQIKPDSCGLPPNMGILFLHSKCMWSIVPMGAYLDCFYEGLGPKSRVDAKGPSDKWLPATVSRREGNRAWVVFDDPSFDSELVNRVKEDLAPFGSKR